MLLRARSYWGRGNTTEGNECATLDSSTRNAGEIVDCDSVTVHITTVSLLAKNALCQHYIFYVNS